LQKILSSQKKYKLGQTTCWPRYDEEKNTPKTSSNLI
jgi:hypothetical protein